MNAPHTLAEQLAALLAEKQALEQDLHAERIGRLLAERRHRTERVLTERRGRNPQRKGFEEWSDVDFALDND